MDRAALRHIVLLSVFGASCAFAAQAQICDLPAPVKPRDFPEQPINIFIPRSSASGSLGLNAEIARAIRDLTDENGNSLNIQVNTLFKYGGDQHAAFDYFQSLPPNGYNVIQLNDTYASLLARSPEGTDSLIPISLAQITFSQLYVRDKGSQIKTLDDLRDYAAGGIEGDAPPPVKIALFKASDAQVGLEDILLDKFAAFLPQAPAADPADPADPETAALAKPAVAMNIIPAGHESGPERYLSLFRSPSDSDHSDALIEQPGDVARLINGRLLKPIFTFLPEQELDRVSHDLRDRLGVTEAFPQQGSAHCAIYYRYRGFFIPQGVPPERRAYLEWVFRKAFDSDSFHEFNRQEYIDVLYADEDIASSYCSTPALNAFFQKSVAEYRECLNDPSLAGTGTGTGASAGATALTGTSP